MPDPLAIIVPGGGIASLEAMGNERLLNYLRFAEYGAELVSSVSTGAFVLAAAGLLEGRQATTRPTLTSSKSWESTTSRVIRWRMASSAGIDMALQLVARLTDEDTARRVQRFLGYDPHPPYGGIDYDRLGAWASTVRAGVSLAAPMIAAKPKRLTRQNR